MRENHFDARYVTVVCFFESNVSTGMIDEMIAFVLVSSRHYPRAQRYVADLDTRLTVAGFVLFYARSPTANNYPNHVTFFGVRRYHNGWLPLSERRARSIHQHARPALVRFNLLSFSLSLLFFLLLLSLPASRARREKKMRGSRSFIPRRMIRRNYHAARSRCTRASERAHTPVLL